MRKRIKLDYDKSKLFAMYSLITAIYFIGFIIMLELFYLLNFLGRMFVIFLIIALGIIMIARTNRFFRMLKNEVD